MKECHNWGNQEGVGEGAGKVFVADCVSDYFLRQLSRCEIIGSEGHRRFVVP